ncbi:M23 family peptidase [Alteromonas aestuariivivens]|uniref:M23 family peptidase n=1 Tax=Alteromonas aestuariivivens TaxID=1938339 RepID=A0A3D8M8Y3_9ALTE|nr:M23 family metallopeptidase [Alteromonas aestuariivivens]RDV26192.1 M23 family peptidase [Alteromonas aestuariivivens]
MVAFCLLSAAGVANPSNDALILNGPLTQGSLLRGQLPPGSKVFLNNQSLNVNPQGKFVFGFERDAGPNHQLHWILPDGTRQQRALELSQRQYDIQRIDGLQQNMVSPPEEVLTRIREDGIKVARARSGVSELDAVFTRFIWPADGPITGVYGSQRILNGEPRRPHFGVDVGSPTGTPVVAPATGVVTLADDLYFSGNTVVLDHGMGVFSTFLHLNEFSVKVGDRLEQGQQLGTIGATGRATGPHLDWRINLGTMRLDPALLLPPR